MENVLLTSLMRRTCGGEMDSQAGKVYVWNMFFCCCCYKAASSFHSFFLSSVLLSPRVCDVESALLCCSRLTG